MIFVVWENPNNVISSIFPYFYSRYPKSARYYIGRRVTDSDMEVISHPPIVKSGWLILCPASMKSHVLKKLDSAPCQNLILIAVKNSSELESFQYENDGLEYTLVDNHALKKSEAVTWIIDELQCSGPDAVYLYNRVRGNIRDLVEAVQLVRPMPHHTRDVMAACVQQNSKASVQDIAEYLLRVERRHVSRSDVIKTIYKFRFAFRWLIQELQDFVGSYILVFSLMDSGEMDVDNYLQVKRVSADKKIRSLSDYKLKNIVINYGRVSLEYLCFVKIQLAAAGKSSMGIIKLLQLLEIN